MRSDICLVEPRGSGVDATQPETVLLESQGRGGSAARSNTLHVEPRGSGVDASQPETVLTES